MSFHLSYLVHLHISHLHISRLMQQSPTENLLHLTESRKLRDNTIEDPKLFTWKREDKNVNLINKIWHTLCCMLTGT